MNKKVIVMGSGGHAKVLLDILNLLKYDVIGYTDMKQSKHRFNLSYLGDDQQILRYSTEEILLVNGIGSVGDNRIRKKIFNDFKDVGYTFLTIVHPSAVVAKDVELHEGVQIMAGAVVQPGSIIGENTIINTKTSIDHDCIIGKHVHLAPGVTLSGNVKIEDDVHIGTGATVIQDIHIKKGSIVGAGSVVIRDVHPYCKVIGVPAKEAIQ